MDAKDTCFQFPCSYPLKIMGLNTLQLEPAIQEILKKHVPDETVAYERRLSSSGKYLSITATFTATSREQLNAIYQALNDNKLVVMTL